MKTNNRNEVHLPPASAALLSAKEGATRGIRLLELMARMQEYEHGLLRRIHAELVAHGGTLTVATAEELSSHLAEEEAA